MKSPRANMEKALEIEDTIRAFGKFDADPTVNQGHYDHFAADYD